MDSRNPIRRPQEQYYENLQASISRIPQNCPNATVIKPFKNPNATVIKPFKSPNATVIEPFKNPNATVIKPFKNPDATLTEPFRNPLNSTLDPSFRTQKLPSLNPWYEAVAIGL